MQNCMIYTRLLDHKAEIFTMYKSIRKLNFHLVIFCTVVSYLRFCSPTRFDPVEYSQNVTHRIDRRQTSNCAKTQFTCKSRDCIEESMLCDGVKDCKDGSDETVHVCKNLPCPSYTFRCNYGACIDGTRKCDGRKDCADNSDETHIECPTNSLNAGITKKCKSNEWKCKSSGKCILEDSKCDGRKDCDDGSDETIQECESSQCPAYKFRCNYGACVEMLAKCNGVQECPDGSDEHHCTVPDTRPTSRPTPTRPPTYAPTPTSPGHPTNGVCEVPSYGADKTFVITDANDNLLNISPGSKAPKHSQIVVTCNPKYTLSTGEKVQLAVCFQKEKWNPPLKPCLKTCPTLNPTNVELSCHREGQEIDCNGGDMVNGTRVRPRCKALYHEEKEVYYRELRCQENGEWDNELFKCVPDCGVPSVPTISRPDTLIFNGTNATFGDSPWHVAIYRISISYTLICGGTLISANMVVSAAHCFFDEALGAAVNSTSDYEIVVSKYTRDYKKIDNPHQKKYEIRDIIFTDIGFNPTLTGQYYHDIIVLVLKKPVQVNQYVLPACVQWISTAEGFQPVEGTPGKLVGWGVDKIANVGNPILLSAELPYISYHKCAGIKLKHITPDKFCAGSDAGAGARKGDSGGGLMFRDPNNGRYYLRGIVSTADKDSTVNIATFTDVSKHMDWLYKVRNQVERELIRDETTLNSKVGNNYRRKQLPDNLRNSRQ